MPINPTQDDVGRAVVYRDRSGSKVESGVITSIGAFVFVRYGHDKHSKGTRAEDLEWENVGTDNE